MALSRGQIPRKLGSNQTCDRITQRGRVFSCRSRKRDMLSVHFPTPPSPLVSVTWGDAWASALDHLEVGVSPSSGEPPVGRQRALVVDRLPMLSRPLAQHTGRQTADRLLCPPVPTCTSTSSSASRTKGQTSSSRGKRFRCQAGCLIGGCRGSDCGVLKSSQRPQ